MKSYTFTIAIYAHVEKTIEADSEEDARKIAEEYMNSDISEDSEIFNVVETEIVAIDEE